MTILSWLRSLEYSSTWPPKNFFIILFILTISYWVLVHPQKCIIPKSSEQQTWPDQYCVWPKFTVSVRGELCRITYLEVISLEVGPFDHTKKINQSGGYNLFAIAAIVSWRGVTAVLVHHSRRQVKIDTPSAVSDLYSIPVRERWSYFSVGNTWKYCSKLAQIRKSKSFFLIKGEGLT